MQLVLFMVWIIVTVVPTILPLRIVVMGIALVMFALTRWLHVQKALMHNKCPDCFTRLTCTATPRQRQTCGRCHWAYPLF